MSEEHISFAFVGRLQVRGAHLREHRAACARRPTRCPLSCGCQVPQGDMAAHFAEMHDAEVIDCTEAGLAHMRCEVSVELGADEGAVSVSGGALVGLVAPGAYLCILARPLSGPGPFRLLLASSLWRQVGNYGKKSGITWPHSSSHSTLNRYNEDLMP